MTLERPDPDVSKAEQAALEDPAVMAAVREAKNGDRTELHFRPAWENGGLDDS
jgi:hypothetical protein